MESDKLKRGPRLHRANHGTNIFVFKASVWAIAFLRQSVLRDHSISAKLDLERLIGSGISGETHRTIAFLVYCYRPPIVIVRRALGFVIPPSIDVHIPIFGARVTFDIPEGNLPDGRPAFTSLTKDRIFVACKEALSTFPEYKSLISTEIAKGADLALAWSRGVKLDWIWLETDINDVHRDWFILFGLAMSQVILVLVDCLCECWH
jgi:hypothetical protein